MDTLRIDYIIGHDDYMDCEIYTSDVYPFMNYDGYEDAKTHKIILYKKGV